jgi:diguanylate cyclase (GGDEF)-like protein
LDLISLELNRADKSGGDAGSAIQFTEQLQILIRGIALHSIESQPEDFAELQRRMANIAATLNPESAPDDVLAAIGGTLRALDEYNRKAESVFKSQVEELRSMVAATADTLQFLVSSSEMSVKQLSFVESQLQLAKGLDDLRQLKTYTAACLHLVRRESTRLQTETTEKVVALKSDVERLSTRLKMAVVKESQDPVTGLPARAAAEQAMENSISDGKPCVAALFLLDRLAFINARFGHEVGDDMVMSCAQMLAKKLSGAKLYRWSGPAFVALFDPLVAPAEAENRARLAAVQQMEKNVDSDQRVLMVVVSLSCHVQHISAQTNAAELFRKLDSSMIAEPKRGTPDA